MNTENMARTEATLRSDSNKCNSGTMLKQLVHEIYNSTQNHPVLSKAIDEGRARDISDEPKVEKIPAIIVGSGPYLTLLFRGW